MFLGDFLFWGVVVCLRENGAHVLPAVCHIALHVPPGQHPQPCEVCTMFCISKGGQVSYLSCRASGRAQAEFPHQSPSCSPLLLKSKEGLQITHIPPLAKKRGGGFYTSLYKAFSTNRFKISDIHPQTDVSMAPVQCTLGFPHTVSTGSDMSFVGVFSFRGDTDLEHAVILLPQVAKFWDHKHESPYPNSDALCHVGFVACGV